MNEALFDSLRTSYKLLARRLTFQPSTTPQKVAAAVDVAADAVHKAQSVLQGIRKQAEARSPETRYVRGVEPRGPFQR